MAGRCTDVRRFRERNEIRTFVYSLFVTKVRYVTLSVPQNLLPPLSFDSTFTLGQENNPLSKWTISVRVRKERKERGGYWKGNRRE